MKTARMCPAQDRRIRRYRRSPFLVAEWRGADLILRNSDTMRRFRADAGVVALLSRLHRPRSVGDLESEGVGVTAADLERLADAGVVERIEGEGDGGAEAGHWSVIELAFQRNGNAGGYREAAVAARAIPPPAAFKPQAIGAVVRLPASEAAVADSRSLSELLARPHQPAAGPSRPPRLDELSAVLHRAARVQRRFTSGDLGEQALRPFASGGARSELEIYVVTRALPELAPGTHHYDPRSHALEPVRSWDDAHAALLDRMGADSDNEILLLVTAVFARVMWKYQGLGLSLIYRDAGCLIRTLELVAADTGIGLRATAGGEAGAATRLLGLDPLEEDPVGWAILCGPGTDVIPPA